jgi:hypothetical protein
VITDSVISVCINQTSYCDLIPLFPTHANKAVFRFLHLIARGHLAPPMRLVFRRLRAGRPHMARVTGGEHFPARTAIRPVLIPPSALDAPPPVEWTEPLRSMFVAGLADSASSTDSPPLPVDALHQIGVDLFAARRWAHSQPLHRRLQPAAVVAVRRAPRGVT